jgi:predicted DNA-binding protein with PD1-like motif
LIRSFLLLVCLITACMSDTSDKKDMVVETIRLMPGEDLYEGLNGFLVREKIEAAFIITCVGSLRQVNIRYANQESYTSLSGHFEILSLVGTLSVNGTHLHITVADGEGNCKGGHLSNGSKIYTTAEIVIGILPNVSYLRELDSTYGYKELVVKKQED